MRLLLVLSALFLAGCDPLCASLATRAGSDTCWAEYRTSPDSMTCVSRELWSNWLSSPKPALWCDPAPGRFGAFSPVENGISPHGGKVAQRVFKPSGLPRPDPPHPWIAPSVRLIERARETISASLAPWDELGIFRASLLNERSRLGPLGLLRLVGFVHLMGASGIHLYAIARLWGAAMVWAAELLEAPSAIAFPVIRGAIFLGWILAWLLSGARPGMLRPWLLVWTRGLARRFGAGLRPWTPLVIALGLDLLRGLGRGERAELQYRAYYALAVGGGILLAERARNPIRAHLSLCLGSWIFAAFWEVFETGTIALATPLLSFVTLPWLCALLYPLMLAWAVLHPAALPVPWGGGLLRASANLLVWLLAWSMRLETLWLLGWHALFLGGVLSWAFLLFTREPRIRRPAGLLLACLLLGARWALPSASAGASSLARDVEQLDVGQGDAALVSGPSAGSFGLIDSGSERALTDEQWIELFALRGISRIQWVALTHLDEDHSGAVKRLSRLIRIGCVVTSAGELGSSRGASYARALARSGLRVGDWGSPCVPFPALAPPARAVAGARNQNMGAVLIPLAGRMIYLSAGDAEGRDEERIGSWARRWIEANGLDGFARILKLSHHGSETSSGGPFLRTFSPDLALISVGEGNHYGHPSWNVLSRLQRMGLEVRRTDRDGAIDVAGLRAEAFRHRRRERRP